MKNVYLIYLSFLLFAFKGYSQGSDVIFWVDNSGSINDTEYSEMSGSIQAIMEKVIACNPANRISVVQYASTNNAADSKIWIETPFTNVATTFTRRTALGNNDFAHESLKLIGNALDGIPNANILSPTTTLNQTPGNSLVIYFFTDAGRALGGSYLVNALSTTIGTNPAFLNYTSFKTTRNATFIVTMVVTGTGDVTWDLEAKNAGAAIASGGGSYIGTIESYPADPDGPGVTPRFLLHKLTFSLTAAEIDNVTEDICSIAVENCVPDLVLVSPTHDVNIGTQDNRQASNSITASNSIISNTSDGGVGIYHAGNTIVLMPGFHSMYRSRFRAYIQECPSDFVGREANLEPNKDNGKEENISLFPNPSSTSVTISLNSSLIQHISIVSMDRRTMLDKEIKGAEKYDIAVSDYKEGIYLVTVTTVDGKIFKSKLVKK
ncbi:3-coathanger stack domain-containing protein [Flavobacterium microcysteis]|uniref:T9SS type A sorting domain-containing protein n=1 Tax=Flavobacterium microcysteis TaxID=2596891 RepID=A0A501QDF9_9FLAO|nr:3-coathanger stack domain-containing protein [Flavobacterium microcysteis]TPD70432.1 T9SS type A sorting domain-containing protein [Flavobacterium microcysteis]